ncbi:hypothetical protein KCP69_24635 [Salmonella enterica subsp. enterica]|nr:hypothetical protein KCP69_24635 [Salmonella enterica subsp. enterica]
MPASISATILADSHLISPINRPACLPVALRLSHLFRQQLSISVLSWRGSTYQPGETPA